MITVIVPWRSLNEPSREQSWRVVKDYWLTNHPEFAVYAVDAGGMPFSRGASINQGVQKHVKAGETFIIADADVLPVVSQVRKAIELAREAPGMVQPFDNYIPLNKDDTAVVWRTGDALTFKNRPTAPWICVSAVLVMTRESFELAGGFDERYRGWGYEDSAFDLMMARNAGLRRLVPGPAWHLSHPGVERTLLEHACHDQNLRLWTELQEKFPYPK